MELTAAIVIGFLLDQWLGDPETWWHPVRAIGWLIGWLERHLRQWFPGTAAGELTAGGVMAVLVLTLTAGITAGLLAAAGRIHPWLHFILLGVMCWQILAAKSLKAESMKVYHALTAGDIKRARWAVSRIVGRDTEPLSEEGMIRAAVETVAENASDGVIAPLFYLLLGGPILGFLYKAVNTMDSMIGYKNDRYLHFGRTAARMDDVFNFIPARISAWLMIGAAYLCGQNGKSAWKIYRRDRHNHASPNAAQTEAVCAGALMVQLAGNAYYFGKLYEKPAIGDPIRPVCAEDIPKACRLMYLTAGLMLILGNAVRIAVYVLA